MATAAEIAALRLMIAEPDNADPYADAALATRIDAASSLEAVAFDVWGEKAATAAGLVDISEGGSSRKNSDIQEQYLRMRTMYGELSGAIGATGRTRVSRLSR